MDITFLGHSAFKIKGKTISIVTDPFDPKMVGLKFPKVDAEIVTISHHHHDHDAVSEVMNVRKIVDGPGEYEIGGVSINGFASYHDDKKGEIRGNNTIYAIVVDDIKIVHLGDLGHTLSQEEAKEIGETDILMIPVGGEFTINASQAVEVVKVLNPTIILPMHYQMPGLNQEVLGALAPVDTFVGEVGIKVEKLPKLVIKEGSLVAEDKKVVILDKH